jgi:hypothetical protein
VWMMKWLMRGVKDQYQALNFLICQIAQPH